ncbi:F-box protein At2g26850-like isoform X1 [Gastrolobium bilobum]|uniref:F-box protein At2g26850-like isoform X1 n=1 Tax=Gastrolobium bilobum TaxID=150636 RepID=UPI002AB0847E|nr:F-box protein At2g26850-like isoform X1 [Gastrolobium bilobum]
MLLYFITCLSFFLFLKSLLLKPLPSWATEMRLLSLLFRQELSVKTISKLFGNRLWLGFLCQIPARMSLVRKSLTSRVENVEESQDLTVLDLPELALECILERLPPSSLCQMAGVCRSLRERCVSDHLWERHLKQKWGRVISPAAYREWKWHIASKRNFGGLKLGKQRGLMRFVSLRWPFPWMRLKVDANNSSKQRSSLPVDSVINWYLALETGNFWFPAQVYNRENGHVGFMLSCYDAELSYDPQTDTFQARYPPHGRRADARECGIPWERLRAPPVDTSPHDLHISDCLNDLHPGDHIEIQWRRNKEFPYGWWYGFVGHLESCDGNENYCRCHSSDTVVLEFNHYTPGSRWRQTNVSRKDHREEGNEADGFYGGIRKITSEAEISIWKRLWPSEVLD